MARIAGTIVTRFALLCLALAMAGTSSLWADEPAKPAPEAAAKKTRTIGILLYPKFELLDVYGPAEIFGNLPGKLKVVMVAEKAGPVASAQGPQVVADYGFEDCPQLDLLLVPGGFGTLSQFSNA